jgi:putative membrane protein
MTAPTNTPPTPPSTQQPAHASPDATQPAERPSLTPGGAMRFEDHHPMPVLIGLALAGGLLMGVANIVPGISGGAMLLLMGVYAAFLTGLADITSLRWRVRAFVAVGCVGLGALTSIVLLAGPVKDLIFNYRWQSYSVLIGMRLGIIPAIWMMARPATRSLWIGVAAGVLITGLAAIFKYRPDLIGAASTGPVMLFFGGLAAASATILPGLDGSYLLLLLGQYVPVLGAIDALKNAVTSGQFRDATGPLGLLIPFGLGAAIGIGGVSVLLRWLFNKHPKPTFGVLLGVLCGAFIGLWPFAVFRAPMPGETVKGRLIPDAEAAAKVAQENWPLQFFTPTPAQALGAVAFILLGIALAWLLSRLDPEHRSQ